MDAGSNSKNSKVEVVITNIKSMTTYKLLHNGNMWDVPMHMTTNKAHKRIAIVEKLESFVEYLEDNERMIHLVEFLLIGSVIVWLFS